MFKRRYILLASLIFLWIACKKETPIVEATIIDTGSIAADGCDWVVVVNNVYYHPESLTDQFKKNNLKVTISYKTLSSKFQCGILPISAKNPGMTVIQIQSIKSTN